MGYVLVSADFSGVTSTQRDKIYECLEKKNWTKLTNIGRDISTSWFGNFNSSVSEQTALETSINNFVDCSKPYTKPKLVLHYGHNKPTIY
ncbi:MAG: hypothetical protein NTY74_11300 [Ignavibacteriae bacterium]|nr:hypothetical protein [Ignavibacteriota bacterium]